MKFLCVLCDAGMKLERVEEPEDGSLSVVFACAGCGHRMAMLTNPWETQLVRALDVKIGGRSSPAEPMEFIRSMLASRRDPGRDLVGQEASASGEASPSKCPFSAMANLVAEKARTDGESGSRTASGSSQSQPASESPGGPAVWSEDAERRLERIPEFLRPMIRQGIEQFAAERGYRHITEDVMTEARGGFGM